jgi:hypothetical protein
MHKLVSRWIDQWYISAVVIELIGAVNLVSETLGGYGDTDNISLMCLEGGLNEKEKS